MSVCFYANKSLSFEAILMNLGKGPSIYCTQYISMSEPVGYFFYIFYCFFQISINMYILLCLLCLNAFIYYVLIVYKHVFNSFSQLRLLKNCVGGGCVRCKAFVAVLGLDSSVVGFCMFRV